jgi:ribonuclease T2
MIEFAYFVLALSWSPEYCASPGGARDRLQCAERRYGFVTHGLWPQHERGYPRDCAAAPPPVAESLVRSMLDIMPSPALVRHEWRSHGACSGLDAAGYFALVRKAHAGVRIPAEFQNPTQWVTVAPAELKRRFVAENPGYRAGSLAVVCNGRNLREVRVCLTKDLKPRACGAGVRDQCRAEKAALRPVR